MTTIASRFSFFYTNLLSFLAAIMSFALLIGVDIKGHSFALLDLIFTCMLYFGFIFWYIFFSLVNT